MSEERRKILDLLSAGKITVDEAEKLLSALASPEETPSKPEAGESPESCGKPKPKFLRIMVKKSKGEGENVNIRIPLSVLRSGMKLASCLPKSAQDALESKLGEKGVDLEECCGKGEKMDSMIRHLQEMCVDVDKDGECVKICCE